MKERIWKMTCEYQAFVREYQIWLKDYALLYGDQKQQERRELAGLAEGT